MTPQRLRKAKNLGTYQVITIGCQMNKVDSERLAAFLELQGWRSQTDSKKAALLVLNTCGIRQMAEDRVYGLVHRLRQENPSGRIIITGCLSRRLDVQKRLKGKADLFLPINEMVQLPELLNGAALKVKFSLDSVRLKQGEKYLAINPKHESRFTAYVPIGNGCNNFCSYCVVPYARGREVYRPVREIIEEVKKLIKNNYKEIILIAQNVNSYRDGQTDFSRLLRQLAALPGNFWLRFSSSHPKDMSKALIKTLGSSNKICAQLHLAVQSGDDRILKAMNRQYTAKHYIDLIKKVRRARPGLAITTDVIVGFPGETKVQFNNTVKLFQKIGFALAYIAQFSPRPGTVAAKMLDNVSKEEKRLREKKLEVALKKSAQEYNDKFLGRTVRVLIEGINKRGKYYGKTSEYQTVLIEAPDSPNPKLIGKFAAVKISGARPFGLEGQLEG